MFGLNASLTRNFILREWLHLQMRLEAFNATNTPQFDKPNTTFGSNFGFITSTLGSGVNGTGSGRAVRIAAKITF